MMLGEITPFFIALLLGLIFGTQFSGQLSRRGTYFIIGLAIVAAFLFEAPIFTATVFGGYIGPDLSFATPFLGATFGILIGKYVGGK
jgi:uncharacterized membrane protein YgaE (UPF0421/DUF939 family)